MRLHQHVEGLHAHINTHTRTLKHTLQQTQPEQLVSQRMLRGNSVSNHMQGVPELALVQEFDSRLIFNYGHGDFFIL